MSRTHSAKARHFLVPSVMYLSVTLFVLLAADRAFGACSASVQGPMILDVRQCQVVNVSKIKQATDPAVVAFRSLDAAQQNTIFGAYEGTLIDARVVKSRAIHKGFDDTPGALQGQNLKVFVPAGQFDCGNMPQRRISGQMNQICCDGGGIAPCLLGTSYKFTAEKQVGKIGSAAGDKTRINARKTPAYRAAVKAMRNKDYQTAADKFAELKKNAQLDPTGHFLAATAYRKLDRCGQALAMLEELLETKTLDQLWADQDKMVRRAFFLQARCYAKMNLPDKSVVILNGYLREPKRFRAELKLALRHPDFGFIHTSRQYQDFKKKARSLGF